MACQMFGVMWVMSGRMKDCLGSWRGQRGNRTVIHIWRIAPLCIMWCLWRKKNVRSFEGHELGLIELKKMMLQTLFSWRVMWHSPQVLTLAEFKTYVLHFQFKSICIRGLFCILPVYMGCAPLCFIYIDITNQLQAMLQQ
jgi:hypothetical protein